MDIRQLRYFTVIAEEKNISQAARKLHMSQPPLSQQLKLMEEELGVVLVHREGKKLRLTEAGERLYHHAVQVTKLMEEGIEEVKEVGEGLRGTLKLGVNTLSEPSLANFMSEFRQSYPNVKYEIHQNESKQLCQLLRERNIDLAIIRFPVHSEEFSTLQIKREPFYYISVQKMKGPINLDTIHSIPFIIPSTKGQGLFEYTVKTFTSRKLRPNIVCECSDLTLLANLVQGGFGSTIVPESAKGIFINKGLQIYLIDEPEMVSEYGIAWMEKYYLSKVAEKFIKLIKAKTT